MPTGISLEEVGKAIHNIEGVESVHELHIWQLSESKIVASVHVYTSNVHDFMVVAAKIRKTLHNFGIHSSTIQPEYPPSVPVEGSGPVCTVHVPERQFTQTASYSLVPEKCFMSDYLSAEPTGL